VQVAIALDVVDELQDVHWRDRVGKLPAANDQCLGLIAAIDLCAPKQWPFSDE
jgi:hypothetical protein